MKKKTLAFINNGRVFWVGIILISIWLGFYIDYLIEEDLQNFFYMGRKYSLIFIAIILAEYLYKKISGFLKE